MKTDPICGMTVDETTALHADRDGVAFYFCCEGCREQFLKQKQQQREPKNCCHAQHSSKEPPQAPTSKYFCPMCPSVHSDVPGDCPICGMALERNATLVDSSEEDRSELNEMKKRFWVGAAFT